MHPSAVDPGFIVDEIKIGFRASHGFPAEKARRPFECCARTDDNLFVGCSRGLAKA